jgi:pimeloyl-ACP methyl ester carboxylesterase
MPDSSLPTLVLVHGGQHGGWCWRHVADHLRAAGARVFTPTITGVGERAHLLSKDITLQTAVQDVAAVLETEELQDVLLVGHSFGGVPVTGVADRMPERIRRLVYLDAAVCRDGQSVMDILPDDIRLPWLELSRRESGGVSLPIFFEPAAALGVADPDAQAWLNRRLTPHPTRTYTDKTQLRSPVGNGLPATYIVCDQPVFEGLSRCRDLAQELGWDIDTFPSGHDAMLAEPELLAGRLLALARGGAVRGPHLPSIFDPYISPITVHSRQGGIVWKWQCAHPRVHVATTTHTPLCTLPQPCTGRRRPRAAMRRA